VSGLFRACQFVTARGACGSGLSGWPKLERRARARRQNHRKLLWHAPCCLFREMYDRTPVLFPLAAVAATLFSAGVASGQTVAVDPGQPVPIRLVNGVVQGTRPRNLNPRGIGYADCIEDIDPSV
jgi:hypothetical protein